MDSRNRIFSTRKMSALFTARTALLLLLTVYVMLCSPALAEDFVLRNGIKFCDSMSDVISKETLGFRSVDIPDNDQNDYELKYGVNPYTAITNKGEIAGMVGSHVEYHFDSNKQLKMVFYVFIDMPSSLEAIQIDSFNSINDALMSKYGEPRTQSPEDAHILKSIVFNLASISASMSRWSGSYGVFDHYAEWIIDCGEYKVKIEHIEYCDGKSYSEAEAHHMLSYFYFTDADVAAAEQKEIDKLNDAASDL